jgi:hypothetical protein
MLIIWFLTAAVKLQTLLKHRLEASSGKLRTLLTSARKVTICLDGWTKKGLSASYLGISGCFFDPLRRQAKHALLSLVTLQHPHTGEKLATCLEECMEKWGIASDKVLLVVSDNGANMVKAIRLVGERRRMADDAADVDSDSSDEHGNASDDEEDDDDLPLSRFLQMEDVVRYRRLPCMAHCLQLVIKVVYQHPSYQPTLTKARHLVAQIRKSSVMIEKLVDKCGKSVIMDCTTRWNSTYAMTKRLIGLKASVNEIATTNGTDTLIASEWAKLEEISALLEPFAVHTDDLQTDARSLSHILPSLMNLQCHLEQFQPTTGVTGVTGLIKVFGVVYRKCYNCFGMILCLFKAVSAQNRLIFVIHSSHKSELFLFYSDYKFVINKNLRLTLNHFQNLIAYCSAINI